VQWLSCDSIELQPDAQDGWSLMLQRVLHDTGMLVMRTDKAGVGDSIGHSCETLDYDTELAHHRAALAQLRRHPQVDPQRIFIFGVSMGATMAPLIAQGQPIRGIATWGGGARTWFERMIALDDGTCRP
jgi:dienelactone hydrolase